MWQATSVYRRRLSGSSDASVWLVHIHMAGTAFYFVTERGRLKLLCASSKTCSHFYTMCWCHPEVAPADTRLYRCWYVYNMHMKYGISATKINILLFATILLRSSLHAETMRTCSLPFSPRKSGDASSVHTRLSCAPLNRYYRRDWRLSRRLTALRNNYARCLKSQPAPAVVSLCEHHDHHNPPAGHRYQKTPASFLCLMSDVTVRRFVFRYSTAHTNAFFQCSG